MPNVTYIVISSDSEPDQDSSESLKQAIQSADVAQLRSALLSIVGRSEDARRTAEAIFLPRKPKRQAKQFGPIYVTCRRCKQAFMVDDNNDKDCALFHPGKLEPGVYFAWG